MLLLRRCRVCGTVGTRALSSARPLLNHYDTLGIEPDATSKQIKAAYYELSKKYHPDRHKNSDDKQSAAVKFQQVTSAYEVLGSEEKRRVYDATIFANRVKDSYNITNQSTSTGQNVHYGQRRKMYTDLDIDYKNFEQFQRSTRQRRSRHNHWDMPDEFFAEFGGRKFESDYKVRAPHRSANYKDSRAAEREKEERRMMQEMEEMRKKSQHPIPTFEQLYRQQQARKAEEERKVGTKAALIAAAAAFLVYFLKRM